MFLKTCICLSLFFFGGLKNRSRSCCRSSDRSGVGTFGRGGHKIISESYSSLFGFHNVLIRLAGSGAASGSVRTTMTLKTHLFNSEKLVIIKFTKGHLYSSIWHPLCIKVYTLSLFTFTIHFVKKIH